MSTHTYWRIRYRTDGGGNSQFSEVFFYDSNVDLCSGGTVIKSTEFNGTTFAAINAFDRNTSTNYAALGTQNQWIGYIFPTPVEPDEIGFTGCSAAGVPLQNAKSFAVEFSDDGVTWYLYALVDDPGGNMSAGQHREFMLTEIDMDAWDTNPHRYWRLQTIFNGTDSFTSIAECDFMAGGASMNDAHAFTASASSAQGSFPASAAFDNNNTTQWYTAGITVSCWLKVDFGLGNAYAIDAVRVKAPTSDFQRCPRQMLLQYSDDNVNWVNRGATTFTTWTTAQDLTFTMPVLTMSGDWDFDYKILAPKAEGDWDFDYKILAPKVEGDWDFDYKILGPIAGLWDFSYKIYLASSWSFSYHILAEGSDLLGYRHIWSGVRDVAPAARVGVRTGAGIGAATVAPAAPPAYPETPSLAPAVVYAHMHFYADFYERIWITPVDYRLSNPRVGFEYPFNVWNAYDRPNEMTGWTPTDLTGVEFVEGTSPLSIPFDPFELITLHFEITADAPATIDGRFDFTFDMGEGGFNLFALVLGVLKTLPNEPMRELWAWYTVIETSQNGTEQRMAMRDQPRTQVNYDVMILDEDDRIAAYQQLYSFSTRPVLVPMFQYIAPLDASVTAADTTLYFDMSRSDLREGEYVVLFNRFTMQFVIAQVASLNVDGVDLVTPIGIDANVDEWEALPGRSMRLPNKSSLDMEAVDGGATIRGESTVWREVIRPGSTVVLDTYDDLPILIYRPIAEPRIEESFFADVDVIDNNYGEPVQKTLFTNPFVESTKAWMIDRETDMDWWRAFFDYCKGQLKPFILPTWRNDLPLVGTPGLGATSFVSTNSEFIDYSDHPAYAYVMLWSDAGTIIRKVTAAVPDPDGVLVTLDDSIGADPGSNVNLVVSFANLTRLNEDEVQMDHYVNHTTVTLPVRTVNQ